MSTIGSTTPGVDRTAIRDAAAGAAGRGQPVVPGTYTVGGRWYGGEDATGPGPVDDHWRVQGIIEWADPHAVWTRRRHGVPLMVLLGLLPLVLVAERSVALDLVHAVQDWSAGPVAR